MFRQWIFLFSSLFLNVECQCPPESVLYPCECLLAIPSHSYLLYNDNDPETIITQGRSIICENLHESTSLNLSSMFNKLSAFLNDDEKHFDSFLLFNTTIESISENFFDNITFTALMFQENLHLTEIHLDAFRSSSHSVEIFETFNTNLSNSERIFAILRQFVNLRRLSMHNDRLKRIPSNAFNQSKLEEIWFGLENRRTKQPIESIGEFAIANLTNLKLFRLHSPVLQRIDKFAFAQRFPSSTKQPLSLILSGSSINSTSFPLTSLTRFQHRQVSLRFVYTNLTYLDENVFQPFLATNSLSLIELHSTNSAFQCDCRSAWIQRDYENLSRKILGYRCWTWKSTVCLDDKQLDESFD